jgi:hypothetical protein
MFYLLLDRDFLREFSFPSAQACGHGEVGKVSMRVRRMSARSGRVERRGLRASHGEQDQLADDAHGVFVRFHRPVEELFYVLESDGQEFAILLFEPYPQLI